MKRCKKHNTDFSSIIGICASCLRDRLFKLILAQEQAQAQSLAHNNSDNLDSEAKPAIPFTRRKSDTSVASVAVHVSKPYTKPRLNHSLSDQRFHNSPQIAINTGGCIGSTSSSSNSNSNTKKNRNSLSRFSSFSNIFKSKSRNENGDANSKNSVSISNGVERRVCVRDRGMSPVRLSIDGKEDELLSSEYESCKQTPINRRGGGGGGGGGNRSVTELIFCLSPLVRASPNRLWSVKGKPPAATATATSDGDEIRTPVAPHLSYTKSFYANRSRKLADFGRPDPNR